MKLHFLILALAFSSGLFSQSDTALVKNTEIIIARQLSSLSVRKTDDQQNMINDSIIGNLEKILNRPFSFYFNFDSIKNMGILTSPDRNIRFYTWNLPFEDGSQKIFGFVQYAINKDSVNYIKLTDKSENIENGEMLKLSPNNWFGAMYYDMIEKKIDKKTYYFLMGYNPYNLFSNIKILDVFYFDEYGYPFFGKPFFNIDDKLQSRMILEYNEKASISLHYNKKEKMIIFHHLVPIDYKLKNNPAFFGPDFTFDGLKFDDGIWHLQKQVDVRTNY